MDLFDIVSITDHDIRIHDIVKEFQGIPQGDVLLVRIPNLDKGRTELQSLLQQQWGQDFRLGAVGNQTNNLKLVTGSSLGARHCIDENDRAYVTVYSPTWQDASALEGPVIVATSRFTLRHPEHAAHSMPSGIYQVLYQRDFAFDQLRRVQD